MQAPSSIAGLSFEAYAAEPGVSTSMLKRFADAPAKARFGGWKETPALAMGSLVHTAVLEPWALQDRYAVTDLERRGTKAWDEAEAKAGNRILVKRADYDQAIEMRDAVMGHPIAAQILTPEAVIEQSLFWRDEATGLTCKGRPDVIRRDMRIIADVKTTVDASPSDFRWAMIRNRYALQVARYCDGIMATEGWMPDAFVFLAVEKEAPFLTAAYEITAADMEQARLEAADLLRRWAECEAAEAAGADPRAAWPGYPTNLMTLDLAPPARLVA